MSTDNRVVVEFDQHGTEYRDRYPEISHELRGKCPVTWSENHGGYWVVTDLEVAGELLRHPDLLSATKDITGTGNGYQGIQIPNSSPQVTAGFLEMDPPEQLDFRRVLNPYMSPSAIERWEPLVRDFTRACITDVIESGSADFVDDVANIVPAVLTMAMLGLPLADWEIYCEPAHAGIYTKPDSPDLPRVQEQTMRMVMQLAGCIAQARAHPRPGIIKALIDADINGAPLRDDGILGTVFLVIGGGFDTTTALTANAINWLSQHPDERQRLRTEPELLGTATEEFLRYFSPSQGDARTVTQDCEIGGYTFAERDRILLSFGMTNRDPAIFDEPDELRLDRFPNRHSAFGLGNHRCIGSNIARMQFKAIMSESLARLPDFEVGSEGVERYESIGVINGYKHLPITFPPGHRDGEGFAATLVRWQADLDAEAAGASAINDQEQAQR